MKTIRFFDIIWDGDTDLPRDVVFLGARLTIAFPYHPLLSTHTADDAEARVRAELRGLLGETGPIATAEYHWSNASWPTRALHELAEFMDSQILVIGAAPERLDHRQVGLMGRIVHGAPCAVAVAPADYSEQQTHDLLKVGVGFTDTTEARAAVSLGAEMTALNGGELRLIAGSSLSPALAGYAFASPSLPLVEDELYAETKDAAERAASLISPQEDVRLDIRRGDPGRVLVEASRSLDLLIIGSRAYGPLRHALLGSVSSVVMRESHCPILVLPRDTAQQHSKEHRDATHAAADA